MSNAFGFDSSSNHSEVEVKCHHQIDSKPRRSKVVLTWGISYMGAHYAV